MITLKTLLNIILIVLFMCLFQPVFGAQIKQENDKKVTQEAILSEINLYRTRSGLSPLKMNSQISLLAKEHSRQMAQNIIPFGHQGFKERIRKLSKQFNHTHGLAENVAYSFRDAKGIVAGWVNSSPHRKNIKGNFNLTGIGIVSDGHGREYVTQIFVLARQDFEKK